MRILVAPIAPLLLRALLLPSAHAITVVPSSQCAVQCGNVPSSTSGTDLTCGDSSYANSVTAQTFQNCIACELNSTYVDSTTKESDLQWLLYNLRYTVSWCLWGYPNNTNSNVAGTPCGTSFACGGFQEAVEYDSLSTNASEFGYCSTWGSGNVNQCTTCLQQLGNEYYLANFIVALTAGCRQQPAPGSLISLDGTVFQPKLVNIVTPINNTLPSYFTGSSGPVTLGAKVGIAVGGLIFLFLVTGVFIICRGKRRRRTHLQKLARASYRAPEPAWKERQSPESDTSRAFMSPDNQRWQGGNDDSPMSARGGEQVFSPYTSQYTSPVSPSGAAGGRQFPPVPIPLPYDGRNGRAKNDFQRSETELGSPNAIEMNQTQRSDGAVAPIIKAPVPTHVKEQSPQDPTPAGGEKQLGMAM